MNGIPRRPLTPMERVQPKKRAYSKAFERDLIDAIDAIAVDMIAFALCAGTITREAARGCLERLGLYESLGDGA